MRARFAIADAPFDIAPLRAHLLRADAGAYASFEGWVRNHNEGRAALGLRYEAYVALAEAEGTKIVDEALERFEIADAACVHRVLDRRGHPGGHIDRAAHERDRREDVLRRRAHRDPW